MDLWTARIGNRRDQLHISLRSDGGFAQISRSRLRASFAIPRHIFIFNHFRRFPSPQSRAIPFAGSAVRCWYVCPIVRLRLTRLRISRLGLAVRPRRLCTWPRIGRRLRGGSRFAQPRRLVTGWPTRLGRTRRRARSRWRIPRRWRCTVRWLILRRRVPRQSWWSLAGIDSDRHRFGFRTLRVRFRSVRTKRPCPDPSGQSARRGTISVQCAGYRKQSQRISRALRLIHRARVQRHWDRVCLIRTRIPELPIDQNRDRHQRCLAVRCHLQHSNSSWPRIFFLWSLPLSRDNLRPLLLRARHNLAPSNTHDQRNQYCTAPRDSTL